MAVRVPGRLLHSHALVTPLDAPMGLSVGTGELAGEAERWKSIGVRMQKRSEVNY